MARQRAPHTANAQFYINVNNNKQLDYRASNERDFGYAVFGKVVAGREVVDQITNTPTGTRGMFRDVPKEVVLIEKATVVGEGEE